MELLNTTANAYDQSADYMQKTGDIYDQFAGGNTLNNINNYLNPYYEQVISNTLGRMETDRNKSLNLIGDNAAASGAFGGSRHGLAEGEFLTGYNQNVADYTSSLLSQGWDQAAGMARDDLLTGAQGYGNLASGYYNIANDITQQQMDIGTMQQELLQSILTSGADTYNNMISSPEDMLALFSAVLGSDPRANAGTTESSSTPGLFDYLSLGAGVYAAGL